VPAGVRRHVRAAARIYPDERPYIYVWNGKPITGTSARLDGLRRVPDGRMRVQGPSFLIL
jgi:hypothetical protein